MPTTEVEFWTVLDDDGAVVVAVEGYLAYLVALERSPNTVRAYAISLKLWFEFLVQVQLGWNEVKAEHDRVASRGAFGVPTLVFHDDQMLFGPVLVDPPGGAAAVRLWDLTTGWLEFPRVYEVQRPKSAADIDAIATAFSPYLEARDWFSVQNPTP